jgi:hypothetical protein
MQATVVQATEAIRVLEGITAEDHVDPDVHASVAPGGFGLVVLRQPSDPVVPSPSETQVIWPIPGQVTPSAVEVDDG